MKSRGPRVTIHIRAPQELYLELERVSNLTDKSINTLGMEAISELIRPFRRERDIVSAGPELALEEAYKLLQMVTSVLGGVIREQRKKDADSSTGATPGATGSDRETVNGVSTKPKAVPGRLKRGA